MKQVKVTLVRSLNGRIPKHRATVRGLGLRKMHQAVIKDDTPMIRGMINAVAFMLKVEEVTQ
jgi:large subunit ribosomal protein L30